MLVDGLADSRHRVRIVGTCAGAIRHARHALAPWTIQAICLDGDCGGWDDGGATTSLLWRLGTLLLVPRRRETVSAHRGT